MLVFSQKTQYLRAKRLDYPVVTLLTYYSTSVEAQYLFGNDLPDPVDLRENRKLLAQLREKMCILWGNLEEKTELDAISNLPFECCLMEYGVDAEDKGAFQRQYRMHGVTIS